MSPHIEICPICGKKTANFNISENNLRFLNQRFREKTIDEAITLCCVGWNNFPGLRLAADSKVVINALLKGIQEQVTNALTPLDMITKMVYPLSEKLEELIATVPEGVKKEFCEINLQLTEKLKAIYEAATVATEPVQRDLKELNDTINQLINKPVSKGLVNEETLNLAWQEIFVKDKTFKKGGAGQADLVVIPHLELNGKSFGQKIVVERKSGRQKYCGIHLQEAIEHTKAEGSTYGILVYDAPSNLLEVQRPFYVSVSQGVIIAVTDVESGGWKTGREIFEVFQSVLPSDAGEDASKLDFGKLQRTIDEIATVNQQIETLRKCNNSALSNCEKARTMINKLEELIAAYQEKLRDLLYNQGTTQIWPTEKLIQKA
jgi:hypothetical protein